MHIYRVKLRLLEHTFFASREIGPFYETEPLIGNYALTYALGFRHAPYRLEAANSLPSYREDFTVLNEAGLYVTPASFEKLQMALSRFNALSDTYYYRFDNNAVAVQRFDEAGGRKARASNFPQSGRIRMLGLDSEAFFFVLDRNHLIASGKGPQRFSYIRLGKFMSKAYLTWSEPLVAQQIEQQQVTVTGLLNGADLTQTDKLLVYSTYNVHPAPVLRDVEMQGSFWSFQLPATRAASYLPVGMRYLGE